MTTTRPPRDGATDDPLDVRHWEEVEEATELLHEERPIEAILDLRRVLKDSPRNPYAFHYLGVALWETNELEASRDAYRASLAIAPKYLGARIHLSHVLRSLGDLRGAIEQAEVARRQHPEDPEVWHALGLAYAQRGDKDQARRYLEAFLHSNPEFEVSVEVRATLERLGSAPIKDDDDE
jgi:Flp pilus assembly protein TadD